MEIWLVNQYASTPETGAGGRHYYFAKELAKMGHSVYLIAASFSHLLRQPKTFEGNFVIEPVSAGSNFVWVNMPEYLGAHSKKRVFNWFLFAQRLVKLRKKLPESPDVILYSSPSLVPFVSALYLSKCLKAKLIWDIRDIWPLTLTELGGFSVFHPFTILHKLIEVLACKKSDYVVSNLPYAIEAVRKYGVSSERFKWIPNGFSLNEFEKKMVLTENLLTAIPKNKFVIGYAGTLGAANAIDVILKTALVTRKDKDLQYVIVGRGRLEEEAKEFIRSHKLQNITLIETIAKSQIPAMLECFDVCYVGLKKNKLYDYGFSLTKLPEYFMSHRPIICSTDSPFKPVDEARAGITVEAESPQAIADAIRKLKAMPLSQRQALGENGKRYALARHEYSGLAKSLEQVFCEAVRLK